MLKPNHGHLHMLKAQGCTLRSARLLHITGESIFWSRNGYFPSVLERAGFNHERSRQNPQRPRQYKAGARAYMVKRAAAMGRLKPGYRTGRRALGPL